MNKAMLSIGVASSIMMGSLTTNQTKFVHKNVERISEITCETDTIMLLNSTHRSVLPTIQVTSRQEESENETVLTDQEGDAYAYTIQYAKKNVNIRTAPSTDSDIIKVLKFQEKIKVVEQYDELWSKVVYKHKYYYIQSKFLSKKKPKNEDGNYVEYPAPSNNEFKSYEDGDCITRSSKMPEGRIHQRYVLDESTGIYTVDGRYCVAVGSYYTTKIGTKIDLVMKSGKVVKCILVDCKADKDTNKVNQRHNCDGSVTEFIVNTSCLRRNMRKRYGANTGDVSDVCDSLKGEISKIRIYK